MTTVELSTDVAVPVHTAYNQWTQFETFPQFMHGVQKIEQITPIRTHWVTRIAGVEREFDAEISEQRPDERIAWHSLDGPEQSGEVTFHRLDDTHTRVKLRMRFDPEGFAEQVGDKLGLVDVRVHADLENFRKFIEEQGAETGAWRGEVPAPTQSPAFMSPVPPPDDVPAPPPAGDVGTPVSRFDPDESRHRHDGT